MSLQKESKKIPVSDVEVTFKHGKPRGFRVSRYNPYECKLNSKFYFFQEARWDLVRKFLLCGEGLMTVHRYKPVLDDRDTIEIRYDEFRTVLWDERFKVYGRPNSDLSPEEQRLLRIKAADEAWEIRQSRKQQEREDARGSSDD